MGDLAVRLRRLSGFLGHRDAAVLLEAANEIEQLRAAAPPLPSCAQPTEYRLNLLPEVFPQRRHWEVTVRRLNSGKWWVTARHSGALREDGGWDDDVPFSSSVDAVWWAVRSWPLDEALRRAEAALPTVEVMGKTAADVLAASLTEGHRETGAGQ